MFMDSNRIHPPITYSSRLISHLCCLQDILEGKVNNSPRSQVMKIALCSKKVIQRNQFGPSNAGFSVLIFYINLLSIFPSWLLFQTKKFLLAAAYMQLLSLYIHRISYPFSVNLFDPRLYQYLKLSPGDENNI